MEEGYFSASATLCLLIQGNYLKNLSLRDIAWISLSQTIPAAATTDGWFWG
jgi:hypothetical protein